MRGVGWYDGTGFPGASFPLGGWEFLGKVKIVV